MRFCLISKAWYLVLTFQIVAITLPSSIRAVTKLEVAPLPDACRSEKADRTCRRWYRVGGSRIVILQGIQFESGSARLTEESMQILDANIERLKGRTNRIVIVGHTDSVGDPGQNEDLSEARARSVMNYFAARGINPRRMKAIGRGEYSPIASNDTPEGRAKNRRIELHIN